MEGRPEGAGTPEEFEMEGRPHSQGSEVWAERRVVRVWQEEVELQGMLGRVWP